MSAPHRLHCDRAWRRRGCGASEHVFCATRSAATVVVRMLASGHARSQLKAKVKKQSAKCVEANIWVSSNLPNRTTFDAMINFQWADGK